jgi:magnesium-transporting ATPase (P-type)
MTGNEQAVPLTEEHMEAFERAYQSLASNGERILGFAQRELSKKYKKNNYDESMFPMVSSSCLVGC